MTNKPQEPASDRRRRSLSGVLYAAGAFVIWGLSPVYWKALQAVPALEIIAHRTVWACGFLVVLSVIQRRWPELRKVLGSPRLLAVLFATAILVALNWLVYVWAVNAGFILQASLGYYINPLVNVLLGMLFLRERLSRNQALAVAMAGAAVLYRTISIGQFPWIAVILGLGFGIYGLIRKVAPVTSLVGLTIETLWLLPLSAGYLLLLDRQGLGAFLRTDSVIDLLLFGTGVVTAVPLLFFNLGARRINLSTVGIMQFIAPTCMFLLAVTVYGEEFSTDQVATFGLIWAALLIYSVDTARRYRFTKS